MATLCCCLSICWRVDHPPLPGARLIRAEVITAGTASMPRMSSFHSEFKTDMDLEASALWQV